VRPFVRVAALAFAFAVAFAWPGHAQEEPCPAVLQSATRLVLVTAKSMSTPVARVRLFERAATGESWHAVGKGEAAVVGRAGMAWGYAFRSLAGAGEPKKLEGDQRTPAGIYGIGRSFGFTALPRNDHLVLKPGEAICVDDPASPAYNAITSRKALGPRAHGEDMGRISLYRRGLVIDYPSDRATRAGSCIFLHVWRGPAKGTNGCVAMPEPRIEALQSFEAGSAAIAILPENALPRFASCLPSLD
jgi:L,D-peptidoglycan transpeptidase YkuD (ErfK/YbiS/YcfS/YnhG family)